MNREQSEKLLAAYLMVDNRQYGTTGPVVVSYA